MDFIEADINDAAAIAEACREVECIFHEAAIPSVPRSVEDPVSSNCAGVSGTVQLLVAAKDAQVRRVVLCGFFIRIWQRSDAAEIRRYGPNPISPYAVSKLAGEFYMQSFARRLWTGDSDDSVLQCLRPVSGPHFRVLRCVGEVFAEDAGRRDAHHLWRRRTEPRFHLYRERGPRESTGF